MLDKRDSALVWHKINKISTAVTLTAEDARVNDARVMAKESFLKRSTNESFLKRNTNESTLKTKRAAAAAKREGFHATLHRAAALGKTKTFTAEDARVTNESTLKRKRAAAAAEAEAFKSAFRRETLKTSAAREAEAIKLTESKSFIELTEAAERRDRAATVRAETSAYGAEALLNGKDLTMAKALGAVTITA